MPGATDPVRSELRIAAPPEIVFAYFTDPARMVDWMGVAALLDPRPGGTFRVERQRPRRRARRVRRGRAAAPRRLHVGLRRTDAPRDRPAPRASRSTLEPEAARARG